MVTSKSSILCILKILENYSDEDNILNATDIQKYAQKDYDLKLERKSIYRNISFLCEFGYDISIFEENKKGFFLRDRFFENSEIDLLIDAVASSKFIHTKATKELIKKLDVFKSKSGNKGASGVEIIKFNTKTPNKDIFLNIEVINEAIKYKKKIRFTYCTYNLKKELVPRKLEKYIINPYSVVCANENYYLICNNDKFQDISNYRIDFIKDIEILDEKQKPKPKELNFEKHIQKSIYMFSGEIEKIELLCSYKILKDVIDKFGDLAELKEHNEDKFKVTIKANVDGVEFWVMQYLNFCEVVSPISLKETIRCNLLNNLNKFN